MRTIIPGLLGTLLVLGSVPLSANELNLMAMAPDRVGLTVQRSPVLYYYISHATSVPVYFILVGPLEPHRVTPERRVLLPSPTRPGLWAIRLKDYEIVLQQEMQYRWFVLVDTHPGAQGFYDPPLVGGVIERTDPRRIDYDDRPCDRDSVLPASNAGLWYDAFACVNDLIEANPEDRDLRDLRNQLLRLEKIFHSDELPSSPMGFLYRVTHRSTEGVALLDGN